MAVKIKIGNTPNFANGRLASGIDASQTSITLETGHGFSDPATTNDRYNAVIYDESLSHPALDSNVEIVRVTNVAGDVISVLRAQESTSGVAHNTQGQTYRMVAALTEAMMDDIETLFWELGSTGLFVESDQDTVLYDTTQDPTAYTGHKLTIANDGATPVAIDRGTDDGNLLSWFRDEVSVGAVSVASGVVTYGAFMGSHPYQLQPGQSEPPVGAVLVASHKLVKHELVEYVADGREKRRQFMPGQGRRKVDRSQELDTPVHNRFPFLEGTTTANDARAYGIHAGKTGDNTYGRGFGKDAEPVYSSASLGLFVVRVTDTTGNILNGDYLTTSSREFEAEKQADDILHSYTVAKALVDVNWAPIQADPALGYKWKLIPATIHCG